MRERERDRDQGPVEILATCTCTFIFCQRMLTPGRIPLFPHRRVELPSRGERLLFLRGEATKEAGVSRRLQTPVVLRAVNTSPFTAGVGGVGGGRTLTLIPAARDLAEPLTLTSWAQPKRWLFLRRQHFIYSDFIYSPRDSSPALSGEVAGSENLKAPKRMQMRQSNSDHICLVKDVALNINGAVPL